MAAKTKKLESLREPQVKDIECDNMHEIHAANKDSNDHQNDWNNDSNDSEWFSMPHLDKLTATSLNLLETVGKKTIEAINEKDPNFTNTRNFLSKVPASLVPIQSKPNLSQVG